MSYSSVGRGGALGESVGQEVAFDTVVLCAREYQQVRLPGVELLRARLDDSGPPPTRREVAEAWGAAARVARRVRAGKRVLVTCAMGRNRSGLVAGFALVMLGYGRRQAVGMVRAARGPNALSNEYFVALLKGVHPPGRQVDSEGAR